MGIWIENKEGGGSVTASLQMISPIKYILLFWFGLGVCDYCSSMAWAQDKVVCLLSFIVPGLLHRYQRPTPKSLSGQDGWKSPSLVWQKKLKLTQDFQIIYKTQMGNAPCQFVANLSIIASLLPNVSVSSMLICYQVPSCLQMQVKLDQTQADIFTTSGRFGGFVTGGDANNSFI